MSSLYILEIRPLSEVSLANMFSHTVGSLFHFNAVFFSHAEAFYFDDIPFDYSLLYVPFSRGHIGENIAANISDKILLQALSKTLLPMFSFYDFMISGITLKSDPF